MRWTLVALTPALLFLVASTASGQERSCAELCRLDPATVPPECVCAGDVSISSSSAESLLEMTAAELLEAEREYYSERMAPIDNYWVVVESNISPMGSRNCGRSRCRIRSGSTESAAICSRPACRNRGSSSDRRVTASYVVMRCPWACQA